MFSMGWETVIPHPDLPARIADANIRLVWCTDIHVGDSSGNGATSLQAAVDYANIWRPQAFVCTGDLCHMTGAQVQQAWTILRGCHQKLLIATGNHDEEENTLGHGQPNTGALTKANAYGRAAPFYFTTTLGSGDGTLQARVLVLDCNFYNGYAVASPHHAAGQRIGIHTDDPPGGYSRQLGAAQLDWIAGTLAGDVTSDMVLVVLHYNELYDYAALVDILQADARPAIGLCGHVHSGGGVYSKLSTDGQYTLSVYRAPAMLESGGYTVWVFHVAAGAVVIDAATQYNFVKPAGWADNTAPFTVAA